MGSDSEERGLNNRQQEHKRWPSQSKAWAGSAKEAKEKFFIGFRYKTEHTESDDCCGTRAAVKESYGKGRTASQKEGVMRNIEGRRNCK